MAKPSLLSVDNQHAVDLALKLAAAVTRHRAFQHALARALTEQDGNDA